ncbi:energy-coupling factor transporter transmembrane component T family protein [Corynebacterium tapiri]|uniref:Energy-coupling factor transporter transmembrane protein EcfT n=1 Tax=Corynebacterium tapiri TaxID=1448266 RepID=A0A5C4U8Q0_9CORY|nr:energy-coupling factor transporter transmembrane component T [Corynebacterium tapiri]TNM00547.1 energy-coupling factor transporter transmembrane protein EcfT [Corynebacterium tapiri]
MNLLATVNPVTRILALMVLTTPLLVSVDVVSAVIVLAFTVLMAPLCGVGWWRLAKRSVPILIAAPLAAISMALFGAPEGRSYLEFGVFHVTDNSLSLALAILVRVIAIGLPVMVLSANVDPTDVGDGLAQVLRLPQRFVVASVAAFRLVGLLRDDLNSLAQARRARGLSDHRGPRYYFSLAFGVLVGALRRAGKLSTAMEARGFGGPRRRTWARKSQLFTRDYVVIAVCAAVGIGAVVVAALLGYVRFFGVV